MEQVSSIAQREQLELALDYVRDGDTFASPARSVGDLLNIVARLEPKNVNLRVLSTAASRWIPAPPPAD